MQVNEVNLTESSPAELLDQLELLQHDFVSFGAAREKNAGLFGLGVGGVIVGQLQVVVVGGGEGLLRMLSMVVNLIIVLILLVWVVHDFNRWYAFRLSASIPRYDLRLFRHKRLIQVIPLELLRGLGLQAEGLLEVLDQRLLFYHVVHVDQILFVYTCQYKRDSRNSLRQVGLHCRVHSEGLLSDAVDGEVIFGFGGVKHLDGVEDLLAVELRAQT